MELVLQFRYLEKLETSVVDFVMQILGLTFMMTLKENGVI